MALIVAATFAISLWLVLWALDVKVLYATLLAMVIILAAAGVRMALAKLPGNSTA